MEINEQNLFNNPVCIVNHKLQALPPAVQRTRELVAILSDERLYEALGNAEPIESIEKTEDGYLIRTENYTLQVNVKYVLQDRCCGPAKFELEFSEPVSRKM
jgi:hypothetical protein